MFCKPNTCWRHSISSCLTDVILHLVQATEPEGYQLRMQLLVLLTAAAGHILIGDIPGEHKFPSRPEAFQAACKVRTDTLIESKRADPHPPGLTFPLSPRCALLPSPWPLLLPLGLISSWLRSATANHVGDLQGRCSKFH